MSESKAPAGGVQDLSASQQGFLVFLRVIIGWHFLYEGYLKLAADNWSAAGYLANARGPLSGIFQSLAQTPGWLNFVDPFTSWGLTLVGLFLILGLFSRLAALVGVFFLLMFYLSNPPWPGVPTIPGEGSYSIVNKNLIELFALLVLVVFPTGRIAGLDLLVCKWLRREPDTQESPLQTPAA